MTNLKPRAERDGGEERIAGPLRMALLYVALTFLLLALFQVFAPGLGAVEISYTDFKQRVARGQVAEIGADGR